MAGPSYEEMESYAREVALARGMDPDKFVRALKTEGLARNTWQSRVMKNGMREPSYGPMQLLVGDGKNFPKGLGNKMIEETGVDPSDPANWKAAMDFGADTVAKEGWQQWYGPKSAGLDRWYGVGPNAKAIGTTITSNPKTDWAIMAAANRSPEVEGADTAVVAANTSVDNSVAPTSVSEPTLGDKIGSSLFGDTLAAKLKTASAPATATAPAGILNQGFGLLGGLIQPKQPQQSAPIQSTLPAAAAEDAARSEGAAKMMAALIAAKQPKQRGMTINSFPGMV